MSDVQTTALRTSWCGLQVYSVNKKKKNLCKQGFDQLEKTEELSHKTNLLNNEIYSQVQHKNQSLQCLLVNNT
jgi:hypothetical protein